MSLIIPAYGFLASVLPVWLLLLPRDYLSTFLKIGTIGALAIGIAFVMPTFHMPAITEFIHAAARSSAVRLFRSSSLPSPAVRFRASMPLSARARRRR